MPRAAMMPADHPLPIVARPDPAIHAVRDFADARIKSGHDYFFEER